MKVAFENPIFQTIGTPAFKKMFAETKDVDMSKLLIESIRRPRGWMHIPLILARGVDINKKDRTGMTPWIAAILSNDSDIMQQLYEYGGDVNYEGRLLDLVLEKRLYFSLCFLLRRGVKVEKRHLRTEWEDAKLKLECM